MSPASFVRAAVAAALSVPQEQTEAPPKMDDMETDDRSYAAGVEDACSRVAKNSRLTLTMATGGTMGEDIAQRIKRDLLG